ncbi:MAG: PAS domain-containing protein [Leptothrix sp. (in: b-proteobacteria)]
MTTNHLLSFDEPDLLNRLVTLEPAALDAQPFGIIGIDADTVARYYSTHESHMAGLAPEQVLGKLFFSVVAQCMNNFLVAQRFEDAAAQAARLDVTIDYVLTLRMRPTPVKLRLLAAPDQPLRYVLVHRL